jgi:hypothetical protein
VIALADTQVQGTTVCFIRQTLFIFTIFVCALAGLGTSALTLQACKLTVRPAGSSQFPLKGFIEETTEVFIFHFSFLIIESTAARSPQDGATSFFLRNWEYINTYMYM